MLRRFRTMAVVLPSVVEYKTDKYMFAWWTCSTTIPLATISIRGRHGDSEKLEGIDQAGASGFQDHFLRTIALDV